MRKNIRYRTVYIDWVVKNWQFVSSIILSQTVVQILDRINKEIQWGLRLGVAEYKSEKERLIGNTPS